MGQLLNTTLRNFSGGVITARAADELSETESPRAQNTDLFLDAEQRSLVRKRLGASVANATPVSGSPAIIGQYPFRKYATNGTYTLYHLLVSNAGRLDVLSGGAAAAADAAAPTPFTSGTFLPDFATMGNLAFIVNANGDKKKFNGTNVQSFGITRPTVGTMAIAAGAAGSHNGTYEARVSYYNSNTGHESSISDSTAAVVVANKKLSWTNIPVSSDSQVTTRRLYLRNTATMTNFYLAGTVSDNVTTTATTDVADLTLITLGPDTAENDPPPANVKYVATHLSRLFATDGNNLYYSKVGFPEAFDPDNYEVVNTNDSDQITAIHSAHEVLVLFKRTQMYALFGSSPDEWTIRLISADVGCTSHRTVTTIEGVTYWWSLKGPMAWDGAGLPKPIGLPMIAPTIDSSALDFSQLGNFCAAVDDGNQHVLFAVSTLNSTRNDIILPFNYRLGVWSSDRWDPFDVASMAQVEDATTKVPSVMMGSYSGQVFKWWDQTNDAVPAGCTTSGTVTSHNTTTLTDSAATFTTAGGKLIDRYVYIIDPVSVNVQRLRITTNTATQLTVDSAVAINGTVTGFTYYVGGPGFAYDTPWIDYGTPFSKKRHEYLYSEVYSATTGVPVTVEVFLDYDTANAALSTSITTSTNSGVWDTSVWDTPIWDAPTTAHLRTRIGKTSRYIRIRYRNHVPDQAIVLTKIGMRAELLTDKS